jgi:hypothetical protein
MKLLKFILLLVLGLPVAAVADNFDQVKFDYPAPHVTHIFIFEPNVKQPKTLYREIVFKPGDRLFITAGGCVQTGGMGTTTKSYIFPGGDNSGHLYSGTIYIPGVTPPGSENSYERIIGYINRPLVVQAVPPGVATSDQFLHLGYEDDEYDDNSYDSFDDGPGGQCRGQGPAFVSL